MALAADGKKIATGVGRSVKLWNVANGLLQTTFPDQPFISCMALAPDDKLLAVGCGDGTVRLRETATRKDRARLAGLENVVTRVAFTNDGRLLAAQSFRNVKIWEVASNKENATLPACETWALAADSKTVIIGLPGGRLEVWDLAGGQMKVPLEWHVKRVLSVACSADARLVASAGADGKVIVWEPGARNRKVHEWPFGGPVLQVALAPDGRHLVTLNGNGSVCLLRLPGMSPAP